ncbi:hypothetical protein I5U42_09230 [Stenotrophomonas maltophilia]|uniref:hypothetical protein n=1 Tax=Stenotrophomonas maltophilia TaxID=40324 RepID=UPI0018D33302|nr:hypothetical protein [Stenotrophomonas maltophilia]MBH1431473.1 hypothetical protein [Stenotrophomonas maltophilia]MBH1525334.1 hypothetical protein [Stenotrophomonas maltophilia]MBH1817280.1 hypothetical protein [Stenotrophomonas maltophilia]MBH1889872.1 hypothetical protein [Stenotrophomonas maltophilia]MCU1030420.1 hypothetical protein [Stenotrophomonas maltophilia]
MNRFAFGTLLAAAVSLLPLQASASPPQPVGEFLSRPGEALSDFMLRIAPVLDRHTRESGHEVCGMVAQSADSERFGLRLGTTKGAMTCSMLRSNVPAGMRALNVSIHSHPHTRSVMPTSADVSFYAENPLSSGRMIKRGRSERVGGAYFSNGDYAAGPGYLVAEGQLLYQEGKGTERNLGTFDETPGMLAQTN